MKPVSLYLIRLSTGQAYIGVANDIKRRFVEHCRSRYLIGQILRETGPSTATLTTLVVGPKDYIFALEAKAIAIFKTRRPNGLNVSVGGFGGRDHLPSTRQKISRAVSGIKRPPETRAKMSAARVGQICSMDTRRKLSEINTGKRHSKLVRDKISVALTGKPKSLQARHNMAVAQLGSHHSIVARAKMSAAKSGHPWTIARRAAYQASVSDGK